MMINWHEMDNHGRMQVEARWQEADTYRLETVARGQVTQQGEPTRNRIGQAVQHLITWVLAAGQPRRSDAR